MPTDIDPITRRFPELTDMQERYVVEFCTDPSHQGRAAERAGYSPASAETLASRLMQNPAIIKAIYETTAMNLGAALPAALVKLVTLSSSARSEYVQLEASKDLLDRAGLAAPKRINVGGSLVVSFDLS